LYTFLKNEKTFEGFGKGVAAMGLSLAVKKMNKDAKGGDIRWNFTKFIIDKEGNVVARFEPTTDMKVVEKAVVDLL
ncbi:MAG: glutathione peroxidase, partial [Erysipelotrichaceae bacterium]|nr:glutathione peroxidase [Erysipelotrichaceae bacterium]